MKRLAYIFLTAAAALCAAGCQYKEDAPIDRSIRVVLSPSLGTFRANGRTADDKAEYEAVVRVYEGSAISKLTWTASIIDEPNWIDGFQNSIEVKSQFTDIYSGSTYDITEQGICMSLRSNKGTSRNAVIRISLSDGTNVDFKFKQKGEIPDEVHLASVTDLKAWVSDQSEWSDADVVYLDGDIDMNGVDWTPINFSGTFNGQGHKIYNFSQTVNAANFGFFQTMSGSVSNVIFGSKDGENHDGVSEINFDGVGGKFQVGGVCSICQGNLTNVTSFINVNVAATCEANLYASPIVATVDVADITFDGCVNYGNLTAKNGGKTQAKEVLYGGLLARCQPGAGSFITITGCKNYGDMVSQDPFTTAIGGVVGNCPNGHLVKILSCENFGNVAINSSDAPEGFKEGYAGGIAGLLYGGANNGILLKDCVNHADLTASGTTLGDYGGIIGRGRPAEIDGCVNEGKVTYEGTGTAQGLLIGGITGGMYQGGLVHDCVNKGAVLSNKNTVHRMGGITGTMSSGTCEVRDCVNEATVSIIRDFNNDNWQGIGGICGYQENSDAAIIKGCTNKGAILIKCSSNTTHANLIGAGGILGTCKKAMSLSDNVNEASVKAEISGAAQNFAGGVVGYLYLGSSTGDKSRGAISGSTAGGAVGNNCDTVTGTAIAGSVNGSEITEGNAASLAAGSNSGTVTNITFWK